MTSSSSTPERASTEALTCIGGAARALVEARFLRPLGPREHQALETHLLACATCGERYRRLQLAHRVLALGPERALDEPAPLELERIAGDLGLLQPAPAPGLLQRLLAPSWARPLVAGLAVLASVALVAVLARPSADDELVARGGDGAPVSFAAFVVTPAGEVRAHAAGARVSSDDRVKLRAAFADGVAAGALAEVMVVLQPASGPWTVLHLGAPPASGAVEGVTVPGVVPLGGLSGAVTTWALALAPGAPLDEAQLERALGDRPASAEVKARLGARVLGVERFELTVDAAGGAAP